MASPAVTALIGVGRRDVGRRGERRLPLSMSVAQPSPPSRHLLDLDAGQTSDGWTNVPVVESADVCDVSPCIERGMPDLPATPGRKGVMPESDGRAALCELLEHFRHGACTFPALRVIG